MAILLRLRLCHSRCGRGDPAEAQAFASDDTLFKSEFAAAWTKVMNSDRFHGPTGNLCPAFVP